MMYSNRSEYSDRRPNSDRSSRQWNDCNDRWEERCKPYRDDRDSYHRYDGDGHSKTERINRSRDYSDSPKRMYSKDSVNKDWTRKSPVRRCASSPDWSSSERKRQRFTEDNEDDHRHRFDPEDKTYRQSPESFSHLKDFKHALPQEEDFRYKKTRQDSRHMHLHDEFTYKKQHDDCRPLSPYHKERDHHKRSWHCSQERTQSQDHPNESHAKPRERNDDHYADYEDRCQNRTRFLVNGSSEQSITSDVTNHSPTVPGQKSTKGFQRFLDVLNKGVNVAMLTKIVTQTSSEANDRPCSPVSFTKSAEGLRSPISAGRQQESHQSNCHWSKHEGSQRLVSPQPNHRSFSSRMCSLSEQSLQKSNGEQSYLSSNHRSKSPPVVEKTLTPEDERKHRQMQGVLQAIGMELGFEELGQMSHRIQERLYGKKGDDWGCYHRGSKERDTRRTSSPSQQSRSSSSRSNVSPLTQDYSRKKDCYRAQGDVTELHQIQENQAGEFGQNSSSSSLQDNEKCETNSQETSAALEAYSPNPAYAVSEAPHTPVMPTYSPVNCSGLPYPPMTSALPPVLPPNLPPTLPHVVPGLFSPHLPPILSYPHIPPLNVFPTLLTPTRHLLPQHTSNTQSPFSNLPDSNPAQPLHVTQKSKAQSRPRCLQVIETKQPG